MLTEQAQNVTALFSGFQDWRRRIMGVLQVVADDSGRGQPPYLVLAGCILDVERWIAFTDLWQTILDEHPKIEYFKMKEASGLEEQFAGFSEPERDKKLWRLVSALLIHQPQAVRIAVDTGAYNKFFRGQIGKEMDYPTFLGSLEVIGTVMRAQIAGQLSDSAAAEFVFDEQGKESDMLLYTWSQGIPRVCSPPFTDRLMPNRPIFRNDKSFLPLQAADLLAWHYRRALVAEKDGVQFDSPFWEALQTIPCTKAELSEDRLLKLITCIKQNADKEGWLFEYEVPTEHRKRARKIMAERKTVGRTGK